MMKYSIGKLLLLVLLLSPKISNAQVIIQPSPSVLNNPTITGQILAADGTASLPAYSYSSSPTYGWFKGSGSFVELSIAGVSHLGYDANGLAVGVNDSIRWSSAASPESSADLILIRDAANVLAIRNGANEQTLRIGPTGTYTSIASNSGTLIFGVNTGIAVWQMNASAGLVPQTTGGSYNLASKLAINTAPSAPASCGTSPAITTSNGSISWVVTGGTGGAATGCSVTMPAASNGWNCHITNITQTAAHRADRDTRQTASTTTSVTWEYVTVSTGAATVFTASDVFRGVCVGY